MSQLGEVGDPHLVGLVGVSILILVNEPAGGRVGIYAGQRMYMSQFLFW